MKLDREAQQRLLIFAAAAVFLSVHALGMFQYFRLYEREAAQWDCEFPWTTAIVGTAGIAVLLRMLAWAAVRASGGRFTRGRIPAVRVALELGLSIFVGAVFAAAGIAFVDFWVRDFPCGPVVGRQISEFVRYWSAVLIFPATSALVFGAMRMRPRPGAGRDPADPAGKSPVPPE